MSISNSLKSDTLNPVERITRHPGALPQFCKVYAQYTFAILFFKKSLFKLGEKKNLGMKKDIHFKDIKLLQDCVYSPSYSVTFLLNNLGSKHSLVIIFG